MSTEPTYPLTLLVETEQVSASTRAALQAVVDDTLVEDARGARWVVRRFFDQEGDPADGGTGYYEVRGRIPVSPSYPIRPLGFELAGALTAALTGELAGCAAPDFPSTAFGSEPTSEEAALEQAAAAPAGLAWPLRNMRCDRAWRLDPSPGGTRRGSGVVVGHPDTGYTYHRELLSSLDLTRDYDVVDRDVDAEDPVKKRWWWPLDSPGHGTSTGGAIASPEAGLITGAAPEATLVPMRAVRSVVQVSDGEVARAIDRAVRAGVEVISLSLGGVGFYSGIRAAIRRARAAGVIVMAAAGNKVHIVVAPARFSECLAVAGTDEANRPWSGSSRGEPVAISAPAHLVPVARADRNRSPDQPGRRTGVSSGTSYAVAHVAGVAALWLAHHGRPALLARYGPAGLQTAFETILATSGHLRPEGWDEAWGVGVVDALAVLQAPLPVVEPAVVESLMAAPCYTPPLQRLVELGVAGAPWHGDRAAVGGAGDGPEALIGAALHAGGAEVGEVARRHAAELAYLFAEDEWAIPTGGAARSVVPGVPASRGSLPGSLSPSLRARLAPR